MTIDIKAMLHRVVAEVFDENFAVANVSSSDDSWLHGVQVSNCSDKDRTAIIRANYGWMDALVPELNVQTILFDYDDVEAEKEAELRRLCFVMRAYLQGEGRVEQRRRLFRRGTVPILSIEVDGLEWHLGRHLSAVPYPSLRLANGLLPAHEYQRMSVYIGSGAASTDRNRGFGHALIPVAIRPLGQACGPRVPPCRFPSWDVPAEPIQ